MEFYTDLLDERREIFRKANKLEDEVNGIETESQEFGEIKVFRVKILDENGEQALKKPIGSYVTIDTKNLKLADEDEIQATSEIVSKEIKALLDKNIDKQGEILIVGLGNSSVTPDSLGPRVVSELDITRHLLKYAPQYIEKDARSVSAIAPGVLGTTGIETSEIIKSIVKEINPKLVIVIDSLASKSINRISRTIQIADTGIVPGAGVANVRNEISKKTLGIPVIAIGVPMVVDLQTIMKEGIDELIENLQNQAHSTEHLNKLKEKGEYPILENAENKKQEKNRFDNMIVTPKEIDDLIENMKNVVARGINFAI